MNSCFELRVLACPIYHPYILEIAGLMNIKEGNVRVKTGFKKDFIEGRCLD